MDYDDNDFQGHNLHLAGEGSSKLSPVLRDYALPKFDFDDSLQGHLRFDSLVENEVFLGIPSQEDNQWIEDFSRGSSGIEFSSSATESCTISRRNNVWSEATSSESVEMLLKSVGQEERILGETIIEESDAGDELDRLTNKMEPNLKQDDKMEDAIHSQPALSPDDFPDGWNESTGAENPAVECTSEAQKDDPAVYKSFGEVDSHVYSGVIVSEGNVGSDRKCDDANQMEVDSLAKESQVDMKELPPVSGIHIGNTSSSSHNVIASSVKLNNQESIYKVTDVCFENVDGLLEEITEGIEGRNVQIKECDMVGQISSGTVDVTFTNNVEDPHSVPSRLESLVEQKVEINITTIEEPSKLPMKGDCDLQVEEGCKNDVSSSEPSQSCKFEVVVCTEGPEICKQRQGPLLEDSHVACLVDESSERQAIDVGSTKAACPELDIVSVEEKKGFGSDNQMDSLEAQNNEVGDTKGGKKGFGSDNQMDSLEVQNNEVGDTKGGSSFCPALEIGSVVEKEKFHGSDNEMHRRVLTEASVLPGIDHKLEQGDGSGINHVGDLSSLTVAYSSVKLLAERSSSQNLSDVYNTPRVHKEEFLPEGHMPLMLGESMQLNNKILSSKVVGVHSCDQDVPFHERENAKLPAESSGMQCRVVGSLCPDEFSEGHIVTSHGSEFNSSTGNEPESNVAKDKNLSSFDKLNGLPMFPGTGATADEVTSHNHGQKSPVLGVLSMGADENEETVIEVHKDASLLGLNKSLQLATDVEPVHEDGKASQRDQAAVQECSKKLEVCPGLFDSTVKQVEGTEAVGCENHKEISMKRNAEGALVEVADASVLSNKIVAPAEAISVSMVESCFQKDRETIVASGTQTMGQIGPSNRVDLSDESQASVALACSSKCVDDCMNEDGDNSDNLVKDNCESPTVISCTELLPSENGQQGEIKRTTVDSVLHSEATRDTGEKVKLASLQMGKDASKEERSFTFEVRLSGLSEGETGKSWQSFPSGQVHKISRNDEGSPLTSDQSQIDLKTVPEISHGNAQAPVGVITHAGVKMTPERKPRRGSGKAAAREKAKKGNHVKETTPLRQSGKVDKAMMFMGSPGTSQIVQFEELKSCGDVERNVTKTSGVLPIPTSNLPDLNTSVPSAAFFQQPFTDLQQVQLRAQILVYGSLIQESVPDEACMISAFGPSEGGGSLWEPAWRACIEKVRGQKSHASNSETPVQSHSGNKSPDQPVKHSSLQSKVLSSPAGQASSKGIPSPAVNPIIPLSSPLWNVSSPCDGLHSSSMSRGLLDYHQPFSPLHPYQATGVRNFVGHSPSWLSQTPFPGTWVASPQTSPFDVHTRFSVLPNTEPVKLTPAKDPSMPNFPATKHASLPAVANGGGGASVSSGTSSQPDVKKVTVSSSQHSTDPKPRKRKKVPATEGLVQIPLPTLSQTASACVPAVGNHLSKKAPVPEVAGQKSLLAQSQTDTVSTAIVGNISSMSVTGATPPRFVSTSNSGKYLAALSPTSLSDQPRRVDQNVEKKSIISDETLNTVEEAKLQAEAAASHAAAAVGHCHDVWSQLDNQRNSGLTSDVEAKLASAAMAIAAAASVAKAAAAAAKIASNVAVQARLMAEEVSVSSATVNSTRSTEISLSNVPNSSGNATPLSILKDGDGSAYPSSVIAVARETARKRVEAASAASKHAENLHAIVKVAELAAEAVSEAGKIVSIGDPLPLSKLVESGPVDYWKSPQGSPEKGAKSHTVDSDQPKTVSFEELCNVSAKQSMVGPSVVDEAMKPGTVTSFEKDSFRAQRGCRASNLTKNIGVVPESEAGSRSASVIAEDVYTNVSGTSIENGMKEGCLVEVFKDGGNCKAAWYSANILNLNDGKAFVCYTELQADEGSGHLKEWVSLEGDGIKAPKIRIAHPATTMRFDGTRKRRRVAMMDYTWSVGDKVDAWMQDCWREGIVKEKNKNDATTLTIHFPGLEDTSAVRAWHLRPTLTWQDGGWIEWSSARQQSPSQIQGDTPQEKRVKLGSSAIEAKGKDKMSRGVDLLESKKHEELRPLPLSADEKEFNVGKNTRHENKVDAQRTVRTGLQKEGSRVVFGVPKPGKKRKFMDVSKHFDSDQSSKNLNTNDSVKFARYLMPQGSGSRGWKNSTKIDVKERQAAEDKTKVLRSGKPPSALVRALPQKDNYLTSTKSAPHDATTKDQIPEDVISNEDKSSGQPNLKEFGSFSNSQDTSEGPTLVSSLGLPQVAPKKLLSSNAKSERLNKGKLTTTGGRLNKKVEPQVKLIPEVAEPRRSNRKIQPTSRLLEGLQSSLIISKMPSVPHDKSQRSQNRSNTKGNTNHG